MKVTLNKILGMSILLTFQVIPGEIIVPTNFSQRAEINIEYLESDRELIEFISFTVLDYVSSSSEQKYMNSISKIFEKNKSKILVLKASGYTPLVSTFGIDVFHSEKEKNRFQDYLHDLCFDSRSLLVYDAEYAHYSKELLKCYKDKTRNFLTGNKSQFYIYRYFGQFPEWSDFSDFCWGIMLYLLLFLSSLPHLVFFMLIFSFFQNYFKHNESKLKLVTVLVPFVYGVMWFFSMVSLGENYRWRFWGMTLWKFIFYFSGIFFGLGFLGIKQLINRYYYSKDDSFSYLKIGLILLFSPILFFGVGAVGSFRSGSFKVTQNSPAKRQDSSSLGGGKSGGGGAGGNF